MCQSDPRVTAGRLRYAAYGSNLLAARLLARTPSAELLGTACVPGWTLKFNKRGRDGSAKCNIVRAPGGVHVAVYEMDAGDKTRLDAIEGVGAGYERTVLRLPAWGDCLTYTASDTHIDDTLRPFGWYKALVLAGCGALGFPEDYVAAIKRVAHEDDRDLTRHELHLMLLRGGTTVPL